MVVRIRLAKPKASSARRIRNCRVALLAATLLEPIVVATLALGLWRVAAGFHWVGSFAIPSGIFSYWQTWIGAAAALQLCASALNRYGKSRGGVLTGRLIS